jgi:5-methyltetrahydropteroyltriglutamate--homocysteine methyltransferase
MIVRTGLTGPFPRSQALVAATRDLDRGRATAESVEELYARTESEVVALEQRLGFDAVTGGYLRWADLFRPFAETWEGFTVGPLTRWFETNTFYRQPILHSPPVRVAGAIAARLPPAVRGDLGHAGVILPGPYTFTGLLENRSGETEEALVHRLGRLLADETRELATSGATTFQFSEPLLVDRPPERSVAEAVVAAYRALQTAAGAASTVVWTYGADATPAFPLLDRLPVSAVGVDLAETDWESIPATSERRGLGLGIVDPRTTLVEDANEVVRIVKGLAGRRRPSTLWLGPGGPLDLLPFEPATRKLHVLPAARQALAREEASRP